MGSTISNEKCSQCGGIYVIDYYYRTGEEYQFCQRCGKLHNHAIVRDENKNYCYDENGKLKFEDVSSQGFGCMAIASKGFKSIYHLDKPVDEEIKKEYLGILEEDEIDKDECYLTTWDDDKKEVVAVFGTLPKAYDEIYCETQEEGEEHVDNG